MWRARCRADMITIARCLLETHVSAMRSERVAREGEHEIPFPLVAAPVACCAIRATGTSCFRSKSQLQHLRLTRCARESGSGVRPGARDREADDSVFGDGEHPS